MRGVPASFFSGYAWVGLILLLAVCTDASAQRVTVRGFITDSSDGQPLQGANVALEDEAGMLRGAVTDKNGYYQINLVPAGRHEVRVSFIGYAAAVDTLVLGAAPYVTYSRALTPGEALLDEVVVSAEGGAARVQAGLQTVRARDLERLPTPDASGDLATYLQALPGVVSLGDRGGQLYIRGGTPAQNLVLVDGMLIYQPFHIVGFFSAFPEDLVSYVDVYAGGFGARYSGRLSSVIDVTTREGNKQSFEGAASVSPFLTTLRVEGPLRKDAVSVLASARTSIIEKTAPAFLGQDLPLSFGDFFFKLQHTDNENNRCALTALRTYDEGRIDADEARREDVFRWSNFVLGGRCLAFPQTSPYLFEISTSVSSGRNAVGDADDPERSSNTFQLNTDLHLTRFVGRTELKGGFFARMNWLRYDLAEQFQGVVADDDLLLSTGLYTEAKLSLGPYLSLTPGLALTSYPRDFPFTLETRLRAVFRPGGVDGAQEFSAALGLYKQTINGVTDERDAGSAFIAWVPPLREVQQQALHALLGWQRTTSFGLTLSAEGFYKQMRDVPVPTLSALARFTTALVQAESEAYGFDLRAEWQHRSIYGYVGYGFARTEYRAQDDNLGFWFEEPVTQYAPPHDRRHQVNAVLSTELKGFTFNTRWQYGSGLPFTRVLGFDELIRIFGLVDLRDIFGTPRVLYDRPYEGRLPAYHRLDVSVERSFPLRAGSLTVQAGAINVYDRSNLFYFDLFTARRVDQLPLIPSLSVKFETR